VNQRTVLAGGRVIDPANGVDAIHDVEIEDGRITAVGPALTTSETARVIDVTGRVVMPGIIDTHAHISGIGLEGRNGHRMMARVGVTTALDLSGEAGELMNGIEAVGAGLNVAFLRAVLPGRTVSGPDPGAAEVERFIAASLRNGAIGVKCLGGHYPITPGCLNRTIAAAYRRGAYVAVHAGSTEHGSDIEGLEEVVRVADGLPVHIAHINSYCRGQVTDPLAECQRALASLRAAPGARSESYLSSLNGTSGSCEDGLPVSRVTRTCLRMEGFDATEAGLSAAIFAGWANVWTTAGGETKLLCGESGERAWREAGTNAGLSFAVNSPGAAIALAVAKEADGRFSIDALSTDGGGIPRNTIVEQGLPLVRFGALTLEEYVRKASTNGAVMIGCHSKGHLGSGADADVTVLDLESGRAVLSMAGGLVIMVDGVPIGSGGTVLTTQDGRSSLQQRLASERPDIAVRVLE